nr:hypothetical protein 17 [Balneolaceae bacterium]
MKYRKEFEKETGMVLPDLKGMPSVQAYIQRLEQRLEAGQVEPIVPCPGRDLQASDESKPENVDTVESERSFTLKWWKKQYSESVKIHDNALSHGNIGGVIRYGILAEWIEKRIISKANEALKRE